jgi:glycine hydroxymethyltransferase
MHADVAHTFGLKIAGVNKSPFPFADLVTASTSKSMRGPRAGIIY